MVMFSTKLWCAMVKFRDILIVISSAMGAATIGSICRRHMIVRIIY